jgi:hypothetical protein
MKKIILLAAIVFFTNMLKAQDEEKQVKNEEFKTIFGGKKIGGYGGLGIGYTQINEINAVIFNARGAVIMNHWMSFGLAGAGFVNEKTYNQSLNQNISLVGGYGGFLFEPVIFPKSKVHLSFPIIAGMGGISFTTYNDKTDEQYRSSNIETSHTFFVVEPGVEVEFNLFKFMRMSVFGTYRYAADLKWEYSKEEALNAFTVGMNLKFGKF